MFFSSLSLLNNIFISPVSTLKSLLLINKIKKEQELTISNIAVYENKRFIFIEKIEKGADKLRNIAIIQLNKQNEIDSLIFAEEAIKQKDYWLPIKARSFDNNGNSSEFNKQIELNLSKAILNLHYKPYLLTVSENLNLIRLGKKFNINIYKYLHHLSKAVLHLFLPIMFILFFFKEAIEGRDEKNRNLLLTKVVITLTLYYVIEANIYNYAISAQKDFFFPYIIIIIFFGLVMILRKTYLLR